jgi:hypothetical protein
MLCWKEDKKPILLYCQSASAFAGVVLTPEQGHGPQWSGKEHSEMKCMAVLTACMLTIRRTVCTECPPGLEGGIQWEATRDERRIRVVH